MKLICFLVLFGISSNTTAPSNTTALQFNLQELLTMVTNKMLYEKKNLMLGNDVVNMRTYTTISGNEANPYRRTVWVQSDFAENYNREEETYTTSYELRQMEPTNLTDEQPPQKNAQKLSIFYAREGDYLSIVSQINKSAKYIGTGKKYGDYISKYNYNTFIITIKKDDREGVGGYVEIINGKFPW
jgi:hypothetical protein